MCKSYEIEWGAFSLVEFIVSHKNDIGTLYKNAMDIGSGMGVHTEILKAAGLKVSKLDMYSNDATYKVDLIKHNFQKKFDVIFCSHVIEHQRNVGKFLDKIHDLMSDHGVLILTAPKHPTTSLVEGHLNCFHTTFFTQHLIHAGFDMKAGKYLSCNGIENTAIVSKAKNFDLEERDQNGHEWMERHQERSFLKLKPCVIKMDTYFHNSTVFSSIDGKTINIALPNNYQKIGIRIEASRWGFKIEI